MKARILAVPLALGALAGCNIWGGSVPDRFGGWFHHQNGGRTMNLSFGSSGLLELRDLSCDQSFTQFQEWASDGDALVATQAPGAPHFTADPANPGALQASPGMAGPDPEEWLPGGSCPVCPSADAGVVSCDAPQVLDGGAP